MNLFRQINNRTASGRARVQAFTMVEIMIVSAIFLFIVAAVCAVQLFAMRVYTLGATKLSATTGARESMNAIRDQIRSANSAYVGTFTNFVFTQAPNGSLQTGNALQLGYTNTTPPNYIYFYQDPTTNCLYSISNNVLSTRNTLANYVTNYYCFFAEDYRPFNVLTNTQNKYVIHVILQFSQWEFPIGIVVSGGSTNAVNEYDFYSVSARITRRVR
jgi:type II secretory pathway pseudopilin PulG